MSINNMVPVFRFASIRNPKPKAAGPGTTTGVLIDTVLVNNIAAINNSGNSDAVNVTAINTLLQNYISGSSFIKTRDAFNAAVDVNNPTQPGLELMYDNMLVRLLTKSNTNEVYGLLVDTIRKFAASLNGATEQNIRILIPERITFSFTEFSGVNPPPVTDNEPAVILETITKLTDIKNKIAEAKVDNVVSFDAVGQYTQRDLTYQPILLALGKTSISTKEADAIITERLNNTDRKASAERTFPQTEETFSGSSSLRGVENTNVQKVLNEYEYLSQLKNIVAGAIDSQDTTISDTRKVKDNYYASVITGLDARGGISLPAAEKKADTLLADNYKKLDKLLPGRTFALIAGDWKEVTPIVRGKDVTDESGSNILVYSQGCVLKYPVQVADLRIIEQQTVGYLPAEIAHISNTQRGEKNTRVTRRLKKVETAETIITESEVSRETDSQSAERFSIESDATQVQQEENSWNVNATVSYTMGPLSASVSGGYSSSSLALSSNSTAQTYAKDIFTRIVDRVSNRTRIERSVKTIEEFEETVTHEIDNSTAETKSYVYRWLNKLVRGTLKNYGKRLIFEVNIAHPSHFYLTRLIKDKPQLNIPDDPRDFTMGGVSFNPGMLNATNYVSWGKLYNVKLEAPPESKILVSETFNASAGTHFIGKLMPIKKGYECKRAIVTDMYLNGWPGGNALAIMVGNSVTAHWSGTDDFWVPKTFWLANERENLPVSVFQWRQGFIMNIEVHCDLTAEALNEWQLKTYYEILDGYDNMKAAAEAKINEFDINAPGLSPEKKMDAIRTELKKEAIRKMYRCNPFWVDDKYQVGQEYSPDCCLDSYFAERVKFIETVFDWQNMSYELFPYFYTNKSQWNKVLDLTDNDPHFESFLRASYATIRIPVFRDNLKEIAACNFIVNNAIGNYETIPQGLEGLLEELATEPASLFTYDLDGNPIAVPKSTVDLGIFPIPTGLVILECGVQDGVKPIGFPQTAEETTDVSIPKQYSPAIIADSCTP